MAVSFRDRVLGCGLPLDEVIVIGSGILDTLGIRDTNDVDVAVSGELFRKLRGDSSWERKVASWGETYYIKDDCEAWRGWIMDGSGHPTYDDLFEHSVLIDGVRYISLEYLYEWKRTQAREKDLKDVELIKAYKEGKRSH